jgi:hypothetical protein
VPRGFVVRSVPGLRWHPTAVQVPLPRLPGCDAIPTGLAVPQPFLLILIFWLSIIFTSFGLLAPRNATAITALFVCALSVAGAIFLILELGQPLAGLIHISSAPMREALGYLSQ